MQFLLSSIPDITLQTDHSNNREKQDASINIGKYNITREQIELLQIEARTVLTDKFLKKIAETEAVS